MKRTWFITLGLMCAAGFAYADGMPSYPAEKDAASASSQMMEEGRSTAPVRKAKRLPQGDLRYCLELSTNEEIIRCAETRRKRR